MPIKRSRQKGLQWTASRQLIGREGCMATIVEMLLTWPIWEPQVWGFNKIFCPGQRVPHLLLHSGSWTFTRADWGERRGKDPSWPRGSHFPGKSVPLPISPRLLQEKTGIEDTGDILFVDQDTDYRVCTVCENPSSYTLFCSVCMFSFNKHLKEKNPRGRHKNP